LFASRHIPVDFIDHRGLILTILLKFRALLAVLAALLLLLPGVPAHADNGDDFLPPEQAFQLRAEVLDAQHVRLDWTIAPGYHLYRERLQFAAQPPAPQLAAPALPNGMRQFDSNFNREMEIYQNRLVVELALPPPAKAGMPFTLQVGYQGCADAGLCYPPMTLAYRVDPAAPGMLAAMSDAAAAAAPAAAVQGGAAAPPVAAEAPQDDASLAQRTLQSGSAWRIGLAFLAFGLLLSFTPCVLPMVPILSSIIVGGGAVSRGRGFSLALAYCIGMALVYTALGVAAGLAGEGLAGALQKPWVLLTFGAVLTLLALSMFDVYQLQLPGALQSRLSQASGSIRGGRFIGVFIMGALSAMIVGPCVAGPLAGALLYISQTRNVWTGGWALFSMAAGMSVPLLLTGVSAGSLLPRAGAWMNHVKRVFGVVLLGVAVWMVSPLLPNWMSHGEDQGDVRFSRIRSVVELDKVLATSAKPVMLDFYADWCVSCKEMERFTFSQPAVGARLRQVRLLQADVTANTAEDKALMKRFGLFGPPGIILFDAAGKEIPQGRVIGFLGPEPFVQHLARHLKP
jgi:thiol:disulfide interchange protein DsbD